MNYKILVPALLLSFAASTMEAISFDSFSKNVKRIGSKGSEAFRSGSTKKEELKTDETDGTEAPKKKSFMGSVTKYAKTAGTIGLASGQAGLSKYKTMKEKAKLKKAGAAQEATEKETEATETE
ncbi:hypothetical protein H0W26_03705 [Candidatus Dependentiae bacterium]|nr:hypothetical protein [Candidatus Dependentiae bacterium]